MLLDPMVALNSLEPLATTAPNLDTWHGTVKRVNAHATIVANLVTLVVTAPVALMRVPRGLGRPATTVQRQDIWLVIAPKVIACATFARSLDTSAVNALKPEWTLAVPVVPSALCVARLVISPTSAPILLKILVTRSAILAVKEGTFPRTAPRVAEMERDASSVKVLGISLATARSASRAASLVIWRATAARLLRKYSSAHNATAYPNERFLVYYGSGLVYFYRVPDLVL